MFDFAKLVSWLSNTGIATSKKSEDASVNRRRFKRLISDNCEVKIAQKGPFKVTNLSYGGMRVDLSDSNLPHTLKIGQSIPCHLFLDTVNIEINIKVRNIDSHFLGCSFGDLSPAHARAISEFIKPILLGKSFREIDAKRLKSDDDGLKMRWFQGDNGAQVFMWQTFEGENIKQEYYFLDYVITWDKETAGVRTGKLIANRQRGYGRIDPSAIAFFDFPPYKAIKLGKTILESADLPDDVKAKMLEGIISEEKRFFYRYLLQEDGENLYFLPSRQTQQLLVANISTNGIAFLRQSGNKFSDAPISCSGILYIKGKELQAEFELKYFNDQLIGGNLKIIAEEERAVLDKFLAPRLIAQFLEKLPAPLELPEYAPPGATSTLYSGLHNTHILTLLSKTKKLIAGRISFMDKIIAFERRNIVEYKCWQGIVLPSDWEILSYKVSPCNEPSVETLTLCQEIIENSNLIESDVKLAWLEQLIV